MFAKKRREYNRSEVFEKVIKEERKKYSEYKNIKIKKLQSLIIQNSIS